MNPPSKEMLQGLALLAQRESCPRLHHIAENYPTIVPPWEVAGLTVEEYMGNTAQILTEATHAIQTGEPLDHIQALSAMAKMVEVTGFVMKSKELQNLNAVMYKMYATLKEKYNDDTPKLNSGTKGSTSGT